MAVTCKRLCMETCFAHPMRPDDLRSKDPRLSSQPTEDQPHGDPRPATRSPESHDPKEAGDQGANHQRQVTTQPEFRRGPRGKSPGGLKSRGKEWKALSHRRLAIIEIALANDCLPRRKIRCKKESRNPRHVWTFHIELLKETLATCRKCFEGCLLQVASTFGEGSAKSPHQRNH